MADQTWCEITLKQNPDSSKEDYEKDVERLNDKLEEVYNITINDFWEILNEPQWVKYYSFESRGHDIPFCSVANLVARFAWAGQ